MNLMLPDGGFYGDKIVLSKEEINLVKKWINFQYGLKIDELNIDELVPVYLNKETGPKLFEVKFKAHEKLILNEEELLKMIGRI